MTDEQLRNAERDLRALAHLGNRTAGRLADRLAALRTLKPPRGASEKRP